MTFSVLGVVRHNIDYLGKYLGVFPGQIEALELRSGEKKRDVVKVKGGYFVATFWRRRRYVLSIWLKDKCLFQGLLWVPCPQCGEIIIPKFQKAIASGVHAKIIKVTCPNCGFKLSKKQEEIEQKVFCCFTSIRRRS